VKHQSSLGRWCPARVVALALVIALSPLPVFAAPPGTPAGTTSIRQSVAAIGASEKLAATSAPAAQAAPKTNNGSPAFFKTPIGIAVLTTLAVGVGYALYSTQHDRITSAGKK
jgi:hypothetical protein